MPAIYRVLGSSLGLCILLGAVAAQEPEDPVYNGKKASEWAAQVQSRDRRARETATRAMLRIGSPATPHVLKALEASKDSYAREALLVLLQRMGPKAKTAVPPMIALLRSGDGAERVDVIEVLGGIGGEAKAAVPALLQALKDDNQHVRVASAGALGEIRAEADKVIPALEAALQDKNDLVRRIAAESLARFGVRAQPAAPHPGQTNPHATIGTPLAKKTRSDAPPSFVAILGFDKATGIINLAEFRVAHTPVFVEKTIQKNGKSEKIRVTLFKPVTEQALRKFRFDDVQFFAGDGKPLEKTKAMDRLARGGMALLSADGNRVDPRYLGLLRTDVLILVAAQPKKQ